MNFRIPEIPEVVNDMMIRQIGKRRTFIIPVEICAAVGLQEGDFVEVQTQNGAIILKPKRIVDAEQDKNNATPSTIQ
jgi:AbrB family looped-hinge helix DNA binding protein